jgi:hypothetical protein
MINDSKAAQAHSLAASSIAVELWLSGIPSYLGIYVCSSNHRMGKLTSRRSCRHGSNTSFLLAVWRQHPGSLGKAALPENSVAKFGHPGAKGTRLSGLASSPSLEEALWDVGTGR